MDIKTLSAGLSVSAQISVADIKAIQAAGFRTIICNRPDGEEPDQPAFEVIAKAAQSAGLDTLYLPLTPGQDCAAEARELAAALATLPAPALAYCRSGARSTMLHSLAFSPPRTSAT